MAKKEYIVGGDYPLKHDGEVCKPGKTVIIDADAAAELIASGRLIDPSATGKGGGKKSADDGGKK